MRYIRNYATKRIGVYKVNRLSGEGWIVCTKNKEKGYFVTKEEAEMALLEMMFD